MPDPPWMADQSHMDVFMRAAKKCHPDQTAPLLLFIFFPGQSSAFAGTTRVPRVIEKLR